MTNNSILCVAILLGVLCNRSPAQDDMKIPLLRPPIMAVDSIKQPFPGGLRFSADSSAIWFDGLGAWKVTDGESVNSSFLKDYKNAPQIIDFAAKPSSMLVVTRRTGELLFWNQKDGLQRRTLRQTGKVVAARFLDDGKRFAVVFAKPASIYYGHVDAEEEDSVVPLAADFSKCAISPDGGFIASRNIDNIELWDVKKGGIRATLKHENRPFSFAYSHDGRWLATGTSNDNLIHLFDTTSGERLCKLEAHVRGEIFLKTAVYSLAFAPNGKWLASGGHDGRVIVWDLENRQPRWQAQLDGPPIICSLTFSPDSRLLAGSFENANAQRGIRVWGLSAESDEQRHAKD